MLMVMAGGTGGHIYPALAIAKQLQQKGVSIVWLGTREGLEARVIPQQGFDIEWIDIKGVRGTGLLRWLKLPLQLSKAVFQTIAIFNRRKPDALLSMGGFVAGPGGIAGKLKRIPLILHEANAIVGLTNKVLAHIATKVMCAFPNTRGLAKDTEVVGNPVRDDIIALHQANQRLSQNETRLRLLIVGGSQGALSLNKTLPDAISLLDPAIRPEIRHQTGKGRSDEVIEDYQKYGFEVDVREYLDDIAGSYAWADLIICRAGAMTVAEITTAGLPALIVPYPYSAGDHQVFNAQYLVENNAADLLLHQDLSSESLAAKLSRLLTDQQLLAQMSANSLALAKTDATEKAVKVCEQVLYA